MNKNIILHTTLVSILVYIVYKINIQIPNYLDLLGSDDALYLKYGVEFNQHITQEWAPAYNFWYYLLSKFTHNYIELYYLNIQVLYTISVFLFYIFLFQNYKNKYTAFVFACLYSLQPILIGISPKISLFCIDSILFTLVLCHLFKNKLHQYMMFSVGMFWCWYARPEFSIAFIISLFIVFYFWYDILKKEKKANIDAITIYAICISIIVITLKPLTFNKFSGMDKLYIAFVQHWGIYCTITKNKIIGNSTLYELYNKTLVDLFGPERTFIGIIKHQPLIVIKHIFVNILISIKMLQKYTEGYVLPNLYFGWLKRINHIIFISILVAFFYFNRKEIIINPKYWSIKSQTFGTFMVLFFFAVSIPTFLIGFQEHYYLLFFLWFLIAVLYFISTIKKEYKITKALSIIIIFIIINNKPTLSKTMYSHTNPVDANQLPNKKIYKYLQENIPFSKHIIMIATEGGCEVYVNRPNITVIPLLLVGFSDGKSIIESINNYKAEYILVDKSLFIMSKNNVDNGMLKILENPYKYGFTKKIVFKSLKETYLLKR